jgi:hypothetical protein
VQSALAEGSFALFFFSGPFFYDFPQNLPLNRPVCTFLSCQDSLMPKLSANDYTQNFPFHSSNTKKRKKIHIKMRKMRKKMPLLRAA